MKPSAPAKRFLWYLAALAICVLPAGCSGPCYLYFHNEMNFPIVVHYEFAESGASRGIAEDNIDLAAGETKDDSMWIGVTPPSLDISVSGNKMVWHRKFLKAEFPKNVRNDPSLATPFHLYIREKEMILDGPNFWDRGGLWLIIISIAIIVAVVAMVIGTQKPKPPPTNR